MIHYVIGYTGPDKGPDKQRWIAVCGVNNQRPKPGTADPEEVTCLRCMDVLTRPGAA